MSINSGNENVNNGTDGNRREMMADNIYEPIRRKIEEWIYYDDHKPVGEYSKHQEEHDEYRRWHDRDCVLEGEI